MVSALNTSGSVPVFANDEARWAAVARRDRNADGAFYYAVVTTRVYCRPSCPSRRAHRDHVRFYTTADEAERAGFRACKRCRPDELSLSIVHTRAVVAACRSIEAAEQPPALAQLARAAGMSEHYFHRIFKSIMGVTPQAYGKAWQARQVREELVRGGSVTAAMYAAGYNSNSRFYADASARLGMTPSAWQAGGPGADIRFAVGQCSLGAILVAATDRGICAIQFGDEPELLVQELQERFACAHLIGADAAFEALVARVVGQVETPGDCRPLDDLPLDIRGTAFQQRVWAALREIPLGSTATYAQIAQRIGQPQAARAVARACAANDIAVAIPCHRVVRTDGSVSGYRWGIERKRMLLEREARS